MTERILTAGEKKMLESIYGDSINSTVIRINDKALLFGQGRNSITPTNTIYTSKNYEADFSASNVPLYKKAHFIHESWHALEFQNQSIATTVQSVFEQASHQLKFKDMYSLKGITDSSNFMGLSNEQQARLFEYQYQYQNGVTHEQLLAKDPNAPSPEIVRNLTSDVPKKLNRAGFLGEVGNSIDSALSRLGAVGGAVGGVISGTFKSVGNLVTGVQGAVTAFATGVYGAVQELANGNVVSAIGSLAAGVVGAIGSVVSGVVGAVGDFFSGIGNAISSVFSSSDSSSDDNDSGADSSGKPVVIDMDGDGIELTKLNESTTDFDFDDDGYLERTAWTTGDDALLVFDLDNDNKVTQSKEIAFAKWTEEDDTDLEALATHFDTNKDKVLDSRDAGWNSFKIWQDRDTDGVVDDGEMLTLEEAGIKSIGLETRDGTEEVLSDGTVIHGLVDVQKADGSIVDGADVALAYNALGFRSYKDSNSNTVYELENGDVQKIKAFNSQEKNFDLGNDASVWIGAEGNALANTMNAASKTGNVLLSGGAGNDTLIGGVAAYTFSVDQYDFDNVENSLLDDFGWTGSAGTHITQTDTFFHEMLLTRVGENYVVRT